MEALLFVLAWPLIILVVGFLFIAYFSVWGVLSGGWQFLLMPFALAFLIWFMSEMRRKVTAKDLKGQSLAAQSLMVSISAGVLVPLFARELLIAADRALVGMIITLLLGFGLFVWGVFIKGNTTLRRANVIGGFLTVIYSYTQLWELGQGARIIAAAIGLIIAIVIGVARFKDKLK